MYVTGFVVLLTLSVPTGFFQLVPLYPFSDSGEKFVIVPGLLDVPVDLTVIEHYPGHLGIRVTGQHNLNGLLSNLMHQREKLGPIIFGIR